VLFLPLSRADVTAVTLHPPPQVVWWMSFGHSSETANVTAGPMSLSALSTEPMLYKTLECRSLWHSTPASSRSKSISLASRLPKITFHTVGLPDAAVREKPRSRARSAEECGYNIPLTQITINLAQRIFAKRIGIRPAYGAGASSEAYGGLNKKELQDCVFVGELSLMAEYAGPRCASYCH